MDHFLSFLFNYWTMLQVYIQQSVPIGKIMRITVVFFLQTKCYNCFCLISPTSESLSETIWSNYVLGPNHHSQLWLTGYQNQRVKWSLMQCLIFRSQCLLGPKYLSHSVLKLWAVLSLWLVHKYRNQSP